MENKEFEENVSAEANDNETNNEAEAAKENAEANTSEAETTVDESAETETDKETDEASETTEDTADTSDKSSEKSEKKGLFGKNKKDKKDELIEELNDKYKRTFAEFDNFRKRSEREKADMYRIGAKDVIEKILPVVDNFERGFAHISEEDKATPFADGMDKIYKQLLKTMEDLGVEEIDALGKEFNPDLHNAIQHVDDENLGENEVSAVMQKGYTYKGSVVRHSMVVVAN